MGTCSAITFSQRATALPSIVITISSTYRMVIPWLTEIPHPMVCRLIIPRGQAWSRIMPTKPTKSDQLLPLEEEHGTFISFQFPMKFRSSRLTLSLCQRPRYRAEVPVGRMFSPQTIFSKIVAGTARQMRTSIPRAVSLSCLFEKIQAKG